MRLSQLSCCIGKACWRQYVAGLQLSVVQSRSSSVSHVSHTTLTACKASNSDSNGDAQASKPKQHPRLFPGAKQANQPHQVAHLPKHCGKSSLDTALKGSIAAADSSRTHNLNVESLEEIAAATTAAAPLQAVTVQDSSVSFNAASSMIGDMQQLHVVWDLDNKHPDNWLEMPQRIRNLRQALGPAGGNAKITAFANVYTITWVVVGNTPEGPWDANNLSGWGYEEVEDAIMEDGLRCPLCGRRCSSVEQLNKHFKQLHQREHQKRLNAPKKTARKYHESTKAQRYREANHQVGLPRANGAGHKGQALRLLLAKEGVRFVEVQLGRQAVDNAIVEHVKKLKYQLRQTSAESLRQAVLVVVSDDRGFSPLMSNWISSGGADVVVVTRRDPREWNAEWRGRIGKRLHFLSWDAAVMH